jgi:4-deoxy-L-threo-5-hexosulose-uronate ketol-isomerase
MEQQICREKERCIVELRTAVSPKDVKHYTTERLRDEFLIRELFQEDRINLVYSHIDRIIIGAAVPIIPLTLTAGDELRAQYFCERRELGVINIGAPGSITVDGQVYQVGYKEAMYIGMGSKEISFASDNSEAPAKFYFNSAPAHMTYPTVLIKPEGEPAEGVVIVKPENKLELGSLEDANHRVLCKYILPGQVESCQLEMGMTRLEAGSVWNSMPCHTHDRRMEVYMYFDMPEDAFVMHFMGEPDETRHIVMRNEEAVISPSWSIHCGCGSQAYTFIWGMVGENQDFDDMDHVSPKDLF